ncbi:MAG TPA: alkaline phosphatase D family protein [Pirellulales bacterium]
MSIEHLSRRELLSLASSVAPAACLANAALAADDTHEQHQATGVKIGEVTQAGAIVWGRVTRSATRNNDGSVRQGKPREPSPSDEQVPLLEGAVPGMPGRLRVRYKASQEARYRATDWVEVGPATDFSHQFELKGLEPGTPYQVVVDAAGLGGKSDFASTAATFRTAPAAPESSPVGFAIVTCESYRDRDLPDGFRIYKSIPATMTELGLPHDFYVQTGDAVYLDSEDPRATSVALARYHWQRMYGLPLLVDFHAQMPGYWLKDDHDTWADDFWPGQKRPEMGSLTYEQSLAVRRQAVPTGPLPYRTVRWGKHLQIWLMESREFRSPNNMPDGPQKTIWGSAQKEWFKQSVLDSDADWKLLISPTPLVGPDRPTKADNHSNAAFGHEGRELRNWIAANGAGRVLVLCGDRHWQYHSVDPDSGVREFACGPASDQHAGGAPGEDPRYHRFYRVAGGFITGEVTPLPASAASRLTLRFHDVNGKVVFVVQPAGAAGG